jgi:hypothetical protein
MLSKPSGNGTREASFIGISPPTRANREQLKRTHRSAEHDNSDHECADRADPRPHAPGIAIFGKIELTRTGYRS